MLPTISGIVSPKSKPVHESTEPETFHGLSFMFEVLAYGEM
jgi:hypothetical protein